MALFNQSGDGRYKITPISVEGVYQRFCQEDNDRLKPSSLLNVLLPRCLFYDSSKQSLQESPLYVLDLIPNEPLLLNRTDQTKIKGGKR